MHQLVLRILILLATGLTLAGCNQTRRDAGRIGMPRNTVAVAFTTADGLAPTPDQVAAVRAALARQLGSTGWVLIDDVRLASHVVRVHLTPELLDPEKLASANFLLVQPNPYRGISGPIPDSPPPYAYRRYGWPTHGYDPYYDSGYYGGHRRSSGRGSSGSTTTPAPEPTTLPDGQPIYNQPRSAAPSSENLPRASGISVSPPPPSSSGGSSGGSSGSSGGSSGGGSSSGGSSSGGSDGGNVFPPDRDPRGGR